MEQFKKSADCLLDTFFITPFDRRTQANPLADLFVTIRMFQLVVESLRQKVRYEAVAVRQVFAAVLGHLHPGM